MLGGEYIEASEHSVQRGINLNSNASVDILQCLTIKWSQLTGDPGATLSMVTSL